MLRGIRVVEIAGGLAPAVAGLLFAELGAEVIRIEPVAGDPGRGTAAFAIRNRSKTHIAVDIDSPSGKEALDRLLAGADLLLHDLVPGIASAIGLATQALARRYPDLVVATIGAFPPHHPLADLTPIDMLALGAAGVLDEQAAAQRDGPIYLRLPIGSWGAAYLAATGALAKLLARDRGAAAGPVETSLVQGALTSLAMHWYRAEHPSQSLIDGMPKKVEAALFRCADDVWVHLMANCDHVPQMAEALAMLPDALRTPIPPTTTYARMFPLLPANRATFAARPSTEWLEILWAADIPIQPVEPIGQIYGDAQARENGFAVAVDDPVFGATLQPAIPIQIDPPARVRSAATAAVPQARWEPREAASSPPLADTPAHAPLAGIRILDFGNFLAGPFAMMLAADLGAEVIKVEAISGDQMRWIDWGFNGCQRNKRALALQLKDPRAADVLRRLVGRADVVHHNLRLPAARKLGLGYEALSAINPRLVYCHVNSYGSHGPRRDWPGYDQLFQALSGWEQETAGAGNPPAWLRFGMMDHQAAMASLFGTLAALRRRDRTGQGAFVSASLMAAAMMTMSETLMRGDGTITPFDRLDAEQTGPSPRERLYRCADGWIAFYCPSDAAWSAVGSATLEGRFAALPQADAIALAVAAGAIAVPVREDQHHAFLDDVDMRAAGLTTAYPHPKFGRLEQVGSFWTFGGVPSAIRAAPPVLGEHSAIILAELGYDEGEIAAMIADGFVAAA